MSKMQPATPPHPPPLRPVPARALVIGGLARGGTGLVLNGKGGPARFARYGLPIVADSVPDFAGPLAGILAGLDWAAAHAPEIAWVASVPGDCPFLPRDVVPRLHAARAA